MASASSEYSQRIEVPIRERKITEDGPVYGLVVCWASMPSSTSGAARPVSYLCEFNVTYCTSVPESRPAVTGIICPVPDV